MTSNQNLESFVTVYNALPEGENNLREFLVEQLRDMSEATNIREIAYYIDDEILTGGQFTGANATPQQFRSIFRKKIPTGALSTGNNTVAHGITFNSNFTLVKLWVAATDTATPIASVITDDNVEMNGTDIVINSPRDYAKGYIFIEYLKEGD